VHVDQEALMTLTQESLEKSQSITRLEEAAVQLYKALQAGRDTGAYIAYIMQHPDSESLIHSCIIRYGGNNGKATGIQGLQYSIL